MKSLLGNCEEMCRHHREQLLFLRGTLEGRGWFRAWSALELARSLDAGALRKDKVTPRFHHQLQVARLVSTLLPHLIYPEETMAAAFLHDIREDHPSEVNAAALMEQFGPLVSEAVWCLSKKSGGLVKDYNSYFTDLAKCPIASVVKLSDRIHNAFSMENAYTREKQVEYVDEIDQWFFPLIKAARHRFPRQYPAYENLKIMLIIEHELWHARFSDGGTQLVEARTNDHD